jgi:hypothetical protein
MKVNRTYTMELRTLELLARKKNKSLIVNLAVRQYMNHESEFQAGDLPTRQLLAILSQRTDMSPILINAIKFELLHGFK